MFISTCLFTLMILLLLAPVRWLLISWFSPSLAPFLSRILVIFSIFFGLEASRNSGGMIVTQRKYALDLLHRVGMENYKPASTPLSTSERLAHDIGALLGTEDSFRY